MTGDTAPRLLSAREAILRSADHIRTVLLDPQMDWRDKDHLLEQAHWRLVQADDQLKAAVEMVNILVSLLDPNTDGGEL